MRAYRAPHLNEARLANRIGRMPYFRVVESASSPFTCVEGRSLLNLASNNYLGLATDHRVVQAVVDAVSEWGAGVTGSRLMNGNLRLHAELEEELSDFLGARRASCSRLGIPPTSGAFRAGGAR